MRPRGRRPQGSDARGDIVAGARRVFATKGYAAASIRGIAREAGVDAALVHHYFDTKARLFTEAVRLVEESDGLVIEPQQIVRGVIEGPRDEIGARWVRAFVTLWDQPGGADRFRAIVRGAVGDENDLDIFRQFLTTEVFTPVVASLGVDHPDLRAQLAAAQILGIGLARFVVEFPALAALDSDAVVAAVGPTIQRYLVDPLPPELLGPRPPGPPPARLVPPGALPDPA